MVMEQVVQNAKNGENKHDSRANANPCPKTHNAPPLALLLFRSNANSRPGRVGVDRQCSADRLGVTRLALLAAAGLRTRAA